MSIYFISQKYSITPQTFQIKSKSIYLLTDINGEIWVWWQIKILMIIVSLIRQPAFLCQPFSIFFFFFFFFFVLVVIKSEKPEVVANWSRIIQTFLFVLGLIKVEKPEVVANWSRIIQTFSGYCSLNPTSSGQQRGLQFSTQFQSHLPLKVKMAPSCLKH